MKAIISCILLFCTTSLLAQDITGKWSGVMEVMGQSLRLSVNIEAAADGYTSTLDSPDQNAFDIPTGSTTFKDNQLNIKIPIINASYEGIYRADSAKIDGTFKQSGLSIPLVLSRKVFEKVVSNRPQEPTTFPYEQVEVTFINPKGGHRLAGTLTIPDQKQFKQVVVLITGSGAQDRNSELLGHRLFLVLSDYLTRNGIAVLRYDERGVGQSTGDFSTATSKDLADDVIAAVNYLKNRPDMKGKQFGLIGHSEGGLIAPIVASHIELDFVTLLAAPGIPITDLMKLQVQKTNEAAGVPPIIVEENIALSTKLYEFVNDNSELSNSELEQAMIEFGKKEYATAPAVVKTIEEQAPQLSTNWYRYFIASDPTKYLNQLKCPVLAINGTLDVQVTADENLAGIEAALKAGGNDNYRIEKMEGQNHLFQMATTGAISEYGKIEETFNENTMQLIVEWLEDIR